MDAMMRDNRHDEYDAIMEKITEPRMILESIFCNPITMDLLFVLDSIAHLADCFKGGHALASIGFERFG